MINRVTENMKFTTITNSLFNVQGKSANLMEKMSTEKNINRPSDDPIGAGKVLNYTSTIASIEQYQTNITNAETWLSVTDTALSSIYDLIGEAQEIAISQSSSSASEETMASSADVIAALIKDAVALMNTKQGDSYIFSGSRTDVAPFSSTPLATSIGNASAAAGNTFDGTAASGGNYTGTVDKTFAVRIIDGGTLADATYQISEDGGTTWSTASAAGDLAGGTVTLGEGVTITFADTGSNHLTAGDEFSIPVTASVAYISAASAATVNAFDGIVTSGGSYTGTENNTYAVKIVSAGTSTTAATYQVSADGGKSWGAAQNFPARTLQGSEANTAGGAAITSATLWNAIDEADVQDGTVFTINGADHDGNTIATRTYTIPAGGAASGTVDDLLSEIEAAFGGSTEVTAGIDPAGKITVTDNHTGVSNLYMTLTTTNAGAGSLDFGTVAAATTIDVGDGITMTFGESTVELTANDLFTVNAYTAGYYRGNDDQLTMQIGKNNNFAYNINGAAAFTAAGGPVAFAHAARPGTSLTKDSTITLTRGASAGSWTVDANTEYPNMEITSASATQLTIDADGDGTDDIMLELSGKWSTGNTVSFTVTAGSAGPPPTAPSLGAVDVEGPGSVDLLGTLNALQAALDIENTEDLATAMTEVKALIDDLGYIKTQVLQKQTEAGSKANSLELAASNLTALNEQITSMKSGIEDADLDELIIAYQMEQIALEASYNLAAQIGRMTIMDYL